MPPGKKKPSGSGRGKNPGRKQPIRRNLKALPFGTGMPPIKTAAEAKKVISNALKYVKGGPEKLYAFTSILNRVMAAKNPDPGAIRLVLAERGKIIFKKMPYTQDSKSLRLLLRPASKAARPSYGKKSSRLLINLERSLKACKFSKCEQIIADINIEVPIEDYLSVAKLLELRAGKHTGLMESVKNHALRIEYINTLVRMYGASANLYDLAGYNMKSNKMSRAAEKLSKKRKQDEGFF